MPSLLYRYLHQSTVSHLQRKTILFSLLRDKFKIIYEMFKYTSIYSLETFPTKNYLFMALWDFQLDVPVYVYKFELKIFR